MQTSSRVANLRRCQPPNLGHFFQVATREPAECTGATGATGWNFPSLTAGFPKNDGFQVRNLQFLGCHVQVNHVNLWEGLKNVVDGEDIS